MAEALCIGFESAQMVWRAVCARIARDNLPSAEARPLLIRLLFGDDKDVDLSSIPASSRVTSVPSRVYMPGIEAFRLEWPEVGGTLHLCVSRQGGRRYVRDAVTHLASNSYPIGSFRRLRDGVIVASPELTFLQMARTMTVAQLIEYGYELCGLYARTSDEPGFCPCPPLATQASISGYLDRIERLRLERGQGMPWGIRRARQAIAHVCDRAASPEEAAVSMILSLPGGLGGYGLPAPRLNERVRLQRATAGLYGFDEFVCDLSWDEGRTVLEYQGSQHKERARRSFDMRKGNVLAADGRNVIQASRDMISSQKLMDEVAKSVSTACGIPWRASGARVLTQRLRLRRDLLMSLDAR